MIFPLLMLIFTGVFYGWFYFHEKTKKKKKAIDEKNLRQETAQNFVNIKNITDDFLYTRDGNIIGYLQVNSISIELLSESEKDSLCEKLTAETSGIDKPFKFLAISRPVDITPLLNHYKELIDNSVDQIQKYLLRKEIDILTDYAISGDVVERQYFFILFDKYEEDIEREFTRNIIEFKNKFEACDISCEKLTGANEIFKLVNLINNPAYVGLEEVF